MQSVIRKMSATPLQAYKSIKEYAVNKKVFTMAKPEVIREVLDMVDFEVSDAADAILEGLDGRA
jgi:hypothetical protein